MTPGFLFQCYLHYSRELEAQCLENLSWLKCRGEHSVHLPGMLGCSFSSSGKMDKSILSICFVDIMTANRFLKCHLALSLEGNACLPHFQKLSAVWKPIADICSSLNPLASHISTWFFASLGLRLFTVEPQNWATKLLYKLWALVLL